MSVPRLALAASACLLLAACASAPPRSDPAEALSSLRAAETAFADGMAKRDFAAFAAFVAEDAVFINGGEPLHGREAVLAHWRRFFEGEAAPFAWRIEIAEIADGGRLGYSEGPVSGADGKAFARYYSTWRREPDGRWRVVFDNGYRLPDCAPGASGTP